MKNTFIAYSDRLETMLAYCEIVPNLHQLHDAVVRTTQRHHEIRQHLAGLRFERRVREFSALRVDL
ncbi:MAG TPA: hypothetical protein VF534_07960 [Paraburkholderia sp.]